MQSLWISSLLRYTEWNRFRHVSLISSSVDVYFNDALGSSIRVFPRRRSMHHFLSDSASTMYARTFHSPPISPAAWGCFMLAEGRCCPRGSVYNFLRNWGIPLEYFNVTLFSQLLLQNAFDKMSIFNNPDCSDNIKLFYFLYLSIFHNNQNQTRKTNQRAIFFPIINNMYYSR